MVRTFKAVRDGLTAGFERIQCAKSDTERKWYGFSEHSVCSAIGSSQRMIEERNGCAELNVANGAMRSVQKNVKTGLSSSAVTVSTTGVSYVTYLSNFCFSLVKLAITFTFSV
jgi:hypothetical protein